MEGIGKGYRFSVRTVLSVVDVFTYHLPIYCFALTPHLVLSTSYMINVMQLDWLNFYCRIIQLIIVLIVNWKHLVWNNLNATFGIYHWYNFMTVSRLFYRFFLFSSLSKQRYTKATCKDKPYILYIQTLQTLNTFTLTRY